MNLKYLGDALDHWKGSIFEFLQRQGVLEEFRIDSMASDVSEWKSADLELLARLLRVRPDQLINHDYDLCIDRSHYFAEIPSRGDLFLDPDTGIKTGRVRIVHHYIHPKELFDVMDRGNNRIVSVYQHIRARNTRERLEEVIATLYGKDGEFFCTSYESGTVALLFLGRNEQRVKAVHECFSNLLGVHSTRRIGFWPCDAR
jgi:hypothetical protein